MFPAVFAIFIHFAGDRACIKDYVFIDAASNTGVFYIWNDGKLEVKNDGEIRYGIEMGIYEEGSSFTLTGEGNVNGKEWEDGTVKYPIIVHMRASEEDGKSAEQVVKEYIHE